ncbi:MAG: hypothetical protein ACR2GQ_04585 [Gemmatimonadota bacterium]|jgi:hypothetical protein
MNRDFVEMLSALSAAGVQFLVVGAHALAAHGVPRATGDLDLWVRPTPENAAGVWAALQAFGAPLTELSLEDLWADDLVYQIGLPPRRIDILTSITGVAFAEAWDSRRTIELEGLHIPVIGRDHLIRNKRAVGRTRDLADLEDLEAAGGDA